MAWDKLRHKLSLKQNRFYKFRLRHMLDKRLYKHIFLCIDVFLVTFEIKAFQFVYSLGVQQQFERICAKQQI